MFKLGVQTKMFPNQVESRIPKSKLVLSVAELEMTELEMAEIEMSALYVRNSE